MEVQSSGGSGGVGRANSSFDSNSNSCPPLLERKQSSSGSSKSSSSSVGSVVSREDSRVPTLSNGKIGDGGDGGQGIDLSALVFEVAIAEEFISSPKRNSGVSNGNPKSRDEVEAGTAAWLPDDKKGKRDIDIDKLMIAPKTTAKSVVTTKQQPFSFTPATTLTEHVMIRKQQTTSDSNRDVHFQRPRALASGILHGDRINKPQQTSHRQIHTFRMELENCECFEKK